MDQNRPDFPQQTSSTKDKKGTAGLPPDGKLIYVSEWRQQFRSFCFAWFALLNLSIAVLAFSLGTLGGACLGLAALATAVISLRAVREKKALAAAITRGRELQRSGRDPEEALEFLKEAVQRFPESPEIQLLYATVLLVFNPDEVAAEVSKAVELGPDDPVILVRAGHLLLSRGDRKAARSCAARANELVQPGFVLMSGLAHLNGLLAALAGQDDVAEQNLRAAVTSEPDNEPWARHLAVFLAERGRPQEGAEVLDEALKHVEKKDELERMRARMAAEAADS